MANLALRFLSLLLYFFSTSAVSNGNLLACNPDMAIGNGTAVMKWVQPPVGSAMYTITAPSATYVPDELVPITLTVLHLDFVYIGLLLVSMANSNNSFVGGWHVLDGDPFFLPATCKFQAVVHANADVKNIVHTFYWRAPAGTGSVSFRALIKQGEQNHGNFYKPADLVLTESSATPAAQSVWKGAPGDSCDETCGKQAMACDAAGTLGLNTPALLQAQVSKYYPCRTPYLKACGPPATGVNSHCYAYNCAGSESFDTTEACSYRTSDHFVSQRFCKCKAGTTIRDPAAPSSGANMTLGLRLAEPVELDPELTLNALEIQDGNVTVDITGPQDRWFAIGWDATYMSGAYTTVVSLNDPTLRPPQDFDNIFSKGWLDSARGWYDIFCQQALVDFCRNVGASATRYFSCALSNATIQLTGEYNATIANTYNVTSSSRVPCKGGKIAPFRPMTVTEHILSDAPRNATKLPGSTVLERSLVDGGQFRIVFSRPIDGDFAFPSKKSLSVIWSIGVTQYFGVSPTGTFHKHSKKSESATTLNLQPIYATCVPDLEQLSSAPGGGGGWACCCVWHSPWLWAAAAAAAGPLPLPGCGEGLCSL